MIMELSDFIKKTMEDKKMSVYSVHLKSGISHAYVRDIQNGKQTQPHPNMLRKLAIGLGVPYEKLLFVSGYLDDLEFVRKTIKEQFTPLFDDGIVDLLYEKDVQTILDLMLNNLSDDTERRRKVFEMLQAILRGSA